MKYYISELLLSNDDRTYGTTFVFQTDGDVETFQDQVIRKYFDDVKEDDDNNLVERSSNTRISSGQPSEIKKDTFDDLKSTYIWEAKDALKGSV